MVAGASGINRGVFEGAAKLLAAASAGTVFTGFVHGKTGLTDDIAGGQRFRLLCSAWIERDHAIATVYGFHSIVGRHWDGTLRRADQIPNARG